MSYDFLWQIALILVSTKVCGLITRRFQMPQVVGALLAGLLLGPAVFGLLPSDSEMIKQLAGVWLPGWLPPRICCRTSLSVLF